MKITEFFKKVKLQNLSHLEKKIKISRQALHSALKTRNMKLQNFESLAKALHYKLDIIPEMSERNLLASLKDAGAPVTQSGGGTLDLELAIALGLKMARNAGLYESLIPYVLAINSDRLNLNRLLGLAFEYGEPAVLGYFIEMAHRFLPHEKFKKALKILAPTKGDEAEPLIEGKKVIFEEIFKKNETALKWNFFVLGKLDDHLLRWRFWKQEKDAREQR